jgi:hypothetical protein
MMNVHKDVNLPEILKVKQCISARIEDFDIDCVLDEETQVNNYDRRNLGNFGKAYCGTFIGKDRLV